MEKNEIVKLSAVAEKASEHPLGVAIYEKGKSEFGAIPDPAKFEAIPEGVLRQYSMIRTYILAQENL